MQERLEVQRQKKQMQESFQAEQKRLEEERRSREVQRRRQELQDIEKKQAMDKIAALKKTTVGAKALKDLTPEVWYDIHTYLVVSVADPGFVQGGFLFTVLLLDFFITHSFCITWEYFMTVKGGSVEPSLDPPLVNFIQCIFLFLFPVYEIQFKIKGVNNFIQWIRLSNLQETNAKIVYKIIST